MTRRAAPLLLATALFCAAFRPAALHAEPARPAAPAPAPARPSDAPAALQPPRPSDAPAAPAPPSAPDAIPTRAAALAASSPTAPFPSLALPASAPLAPSLAPPTSAPAAAADAAIPTTAAALAPPLAPASAAPTALAPPLPPEYRVLDQDGIRFAYHPSTRERIRPLFDRAGAIRAELAAAVGADVLRHVEVRIAAVPAQMVQLAPADVPASASAMAFASANLVVMCDIAPLSTSPPDVEALFTHALAHLALDEALAGASVPAWFHEAFAVHAADTAWLARTRALLDAALRGHLLDLDDVAAFASDSAPASLANAQAVDFLRYLAAQPAPPTDSAPRPDPGEPGGALPALLRAIRHGAAFEPALLLAARAPDRPSLEAAWRHDLTRRYVTSPVLLALLLATLLGDAAWLTLARSRRARARLLARRARPAPTKPPRLQAKRLATARAAAVRGNDAALHLPRELEVPKVEHNGEWHTLH